MAKSVDTKNKKKNKKNEETRDTVRNGGLVQVNIWMDKKDRESFKRLCGIRGWTNGQGLGALIRFVNDVRENPKNVKSLLDEYELNKVSE